MTDSLRPQDLQKKLEHAQDWMSREIKNAEEVRKNLVYNESAKIEWEENNITEKIQKFFSDFTPQEIPNGIIENISSSEILYEHMIHGYHLDGTAVIIWYQKVLDLLVEEKITKWFRKYLQEKWISHSPENKILEKSLYSVVSKQYILWLWRLYAVLQKIKTNEINGIYLLHFSLYLRSTPSLQKSLLDSDFFLQLEQLVNSESIWEKRHQWSLSLQDTKLSRELCIWNLYEKNCLIYTLMDSE